MYKSSFSKSNWKTIIIFLSFTVTVMGLETPHYTLLNKDQKIEIRDYKSAVIAKTFVYDSYKSAASTGFRRIANFIFGGNNRNQGIEMTAPVIISKDIKKNGHEIFFFMPKKYELDELPKPNLENVLLKEIILGKVASISFGGWASEKNANFYTEQLTKYLKLNNYETIGSFMVAQYNSPWAIPPFRKNEILVKIN